jgi:SH3 domain protein
MRRTLLSLIAVMCVLAVFPALSLNAKTMYVRNWIVIAVRSSPNEASQSFANASTNDAVEVLEEGEGWTRIRTKKGAEGWVPSRFLTSQLPGALSTQQCEEKIKALQEENLRLQGLIQTGQQGAVPPAQQTAPKPAAAPVMTTGTADCSALQKQYDKLLKDNKTLTEKLNVLREENNRLKTSERLTFTFIGGVLVILGIIVGLFLQVVRSSHPKKHGLRF